MNSVHTEAVPLGPSAPSDGTFGAYGFVHMFVQNESGVSIGRAFAGALGGHGARP